ncbi:alpha/beta hydrolase [Actinoplanes missouriensis]|uniref:alpha/beta hydrolase n=1 Tax=Actinoplanes missouriensis TaxID=1866 RepID=UPI00340B04CD
MTGRDPRRLHPQARAALEAQVRAPLTRDNLAAVRASIRSAVDAEVGPGPQLASVTEVDAGGVPAVLYRPPVLCRPADGTPTLVYAHGGGWVMGSPATHDGLCRHLARASGWSVLSVRYRLAPETPFPGAADDVERATVWAQRTTDQGQRTGGRVAVAGDSAGAHLAAVVARRARDAGRPLAAQVLICPVLDPAMAYPPLDGYGLHRDEMRFFWDAYAPAPLDRTRPDLDPFRADLTALPPAVVITAELDILRDEGERYAAALLAAGVPVTATRYLGVTHDFVRKLAIFDAAHSAVAQIAAALKLLS